jgi:hypothetical protein
VSNIDEHSRPSQACGASRCRNGGATAIEVAQQSVQRRRAASGARVNGTLIGSNLEDRAAALSLELQFGSVCLSNPAWPRQRQFI